MRTNARREIPNSCLYQQLTEGQRYQLALLYEDKFSLTEIGRRLGVNKSTISRELRRNRTPDGYQPNNAQRLRVFSKDAHEVSNAIISLLSEYKDVCHTITFDNGGEFSQHKAIAKALDAEMYFAHPCASYERGLNENTNGLLRQFIPKGTDLRTVSEEDLQRYQGALNSRPRKCLGFRQPSVVFAELRKAA